MSNNMTAGKLFNTLRELMDTGLIDEETPIVLCHGDYSIFWRAGMVKTVATTLSPADGDDEECYTHGGKTLAVLIDEDMTHSTTRWEPLEK